MSSSRRISLPVNYPLDLEAKPNNKEPKPSEVGLHQVEFHRHGLALVPDPSDRRPGVAYFLKGNPKEVDLRICSCSVAKKQTCPHILMLVGLYKTLKKKYEGKSSYEVFRSSLWYRLATILADKSQETLKSIRLQVVELEPSTKVPFGQEASNRPRYWMNIRPYGHGQATRKGFGANLLFNKHGGFRPLPEYTLGAILRYPYYFKITAVRSFGGWFAHVR